MLRSATGSTVAATPRSTVRWEVSSATTNDLDDLLGELLRRIRQLLSPDLIGVLLVDEGAQELFVRAAWGDDVDEILAERVPIGTGFSGGVAARGEPRVVADLQADPVSPFLVGRGLRSLVGVPLSAVGRVLGVVVVGSREAGRYGDTDEVLLSLVADTLAYTLDHARLLDSERAARARAEQAAARVRRLQGATAALAAALTPAEVAHAVVGAAVSALDAAAGSVWLPADDGANLRVVQGVGYEVGQLERWGRQPVDAPLPAAEAYRTGVPVLIRSVTERDARFPALAAESTSNRSFAAMPLATGSAAGPGDGDVRVLGVLSLSFWQPQAFDDDDEGFLRALAQQCAQALDRARLYAAEHAARTEAEHRQEQLSLLAEAGGILGRSLDYAETLASVARLAVPRLADWCAVDIMRADRSLRRIETHVDPARMPVLRWEMEHYPVDLNAPEGIGRVIRTGEPAFYPQLGDEVWQALARDPEHLRVLREQGFTSGIIAPLTARGHVLGALAFARGENREPFTYDDVDLAVALASRSALAVDNARQFAERSEVAQTLQRSLLPPALPRLPGLEVAARFRPGGGQADIGGDFYDVFQVDDDEWALVIGDVCGTGAQAAALTALARHTIRAGAVQARTPSRVLALLNDALLRDGDPSERFCTVAYAHARVGEGAVELTVGCGGHPPPLLVRPDGAVRPLGVAGTLIGAFEHVEIADTVDRLAAGDALVFYTDGVVEARGREGRFDDERLHALLHEAAGADAATIAARIEDAVVAFEDAGQTPPTARDDVAVLVLRVPPAVVER
jgi:serine phosphatase RsbU (regulator of sigma subunit)/putative methionine-R-sulfoxide reductase with GAF domain